VGKRALAERRAGLIGPLGDRGGGSRGGDLIIHPGGREEFLLSSQELCCKTAARLNV